MNTYIESERDKILKSATHYFTNMNGVKGVFLGGSIPSGKTDYYSDIDLRVILDINIYDKTIENRKSIPRHFGDLLFNQWDDGWKNVCVSHYEPFNKLDIAYYKISDLKPSPWYSLPIIIIFDPENIIKDLIEQSKNLKHHPCMLDVDCSVSNAIACVHETYRRIMRGELIYAEKIFVDFKEGIVKASDWLSDTLSPGYAFSKCEDRISETVKLCLYESYVSLNKNEMLLALQNTTSLYRELIIKLHAKLKLTRTLNADLKAIDIVLDKIKNI